MHGNVFSLFATKGEKTRLKKKIISKRFVKNKKTSGSEHNSFIKNL